MVEAFRRDKSFYVSSSLCLRALESEAKYQITNLDTNEVSESIGRDLLEKGLSVTIVDRPGSALLVHKKK